MPVHVAVGAQWGDEGKGKIVDYLASQDRMIVARYNGGANAGHTLYIDDQKYVLRLLPCGILHHGRTNIVGPYMVCDPQVIVDELKFARSDVFLDQRAAIVLPIHKLLDGVRESSCGDAAIGTTKRGIGPSYEDLVARRAVRLGHLRDKDELVAVLRKGRYYEERVETAKFHGAADPPSLDDTVEWLMGFSKQLVPLVADTVGMIHAANRKDERILFEGAQGIEIDVNFGEQPYQTSSPCGAGGVAMSFGLCNLTRVTGIAKAYATRVGGGELATAMSGEEDEKLRQAGGEYGATTGRNRRCAWLDLPRLTRACEVGGITELVINKLDILGTTFDEFKVCVEHNPEPRYVTIPGWKGEIHGIPMREQLPRGARILLDLVESQTGREVVGIGKGPRRQDVIWKRD